MNRHALERFLFDFDKKPHLVQALRDDPPAAFAGYGLRAEEQQALVARDVATLYAWQVHPLLIRNFCGTLGIRYLAAYAQRGWC